jgi:hypothetical protein
MTPEEQLALAGEFEKPPYSTYKGWKFDFAYPGYFSYYHPEIPYSVYFTPGFDREGEVSIQISDASNESVDGQLVPFFTGDAADLYAIVKQWLEYVEKVSSSPDPRGWWSWTPSRGPWKRRGEA